MKAVQLSPFARVILGLTGGIALGLFVGEPMGQFEIVGDAYIRLLQMTVIPYVLVSLVGGLGGLDASMAKRIGSWGGGLILFVWATTLLSLVCVPFAYPDWDAAAVFSTNLEEATRTFDALTLYLPANPFFSLANTIMPAVVLFSISLGLALIPVENKQGLLDMLRNLSEGLMKMASFVGKLAPYGIFAISAAAAGTLRLEELSRLQVYLWAYLAIWSVIAFWTLPALIGRATPLSYWDVVREARTPMVTAFATGTVLVVLPMIAERCKALLVENDMDSSEARIAIDVLAPTAYSFPSAGTLLGLGFIPFAAWYVGSPLSVDQYLSFTTVGALTAFGSMAVALPFMLDFFSLPADLFQLYLLGSVMTARFATGLAAMHGVAICILGSMALLGHLKIRALLEVAAISVGLTAAIMFTLGFILTNAIPYEYHGGEEFVAMDLHGKPVAVEMVDSLEPLSKRDLKKNRLDIAAERGSLRIGYLPDRLPFAYRRNDGTVVGYDLDLVHAFARDLGLTIELMRVELDAGTAALEDGRIDLLTGAFTVTPERAQNMRFTRPYIDHTLGFAVLDARRQEFSDLSTVRARSGIRIGISTESDSLRRRIRILLPDAEFVDIENPRTFFRGEYEDVDAYIYSAEAAAAWTLVYPNYSIVVPEDVHIRMPAALLLPNDQPEMQRLVDTWLMLSERNGFLEELYSHWILVEHQVDIEPRWSVIRNILGWVE